jgi:signal transduction histidine kinase
VGHAGRVDINGLTPGVHRVEIHAGFDGRSWGPSAFSPVIHVLPPFQDRWWFRALVALVLLTIGWLSTRLYVNRRLAAQRMLFERQQAVLTERMRIAGDMHDDLGVGLSVLKMRSEMALRHEADAAKKSQLQALASTAGELIVNMRHIIWTLNTDQASVEDLMVYITSHVRNSLSEVKITLDMQANGPWPTLELSSEQRRNILLLVKEVLNNILKHARAQHVKFRAKAEGDRLLITITDDGIGMNGNGNGDGGNGLRNMDRRMATLGGKLSISGGTGTTVHMDIPLHGPEAPNKGSIAPGP